MAIEYYFSTDASAPVLSGTVGSLITLLDAVLVNGYGSKAGAGWTKAYSGTNLAAYRMSTVSPATGMYLRVDDTGTTEARVVGYETMSDVNTGTNPFPTNVQISGGAYMWKSGSANATARPWIMVACERGFYFISSGNNTNFNNINTDNYAFNMFFGDIVSRKVTDGYQCMMMAMPIAPNNDQQNFAGTGFPISGHYLARPYTALPGAVQVGKTRCLWNDASTQIGQNQTGVYPDPVSQTAILGKVGVCESSVILRGFLPGLYDPYGGNNYGSIYSTISGQGNTAGMNFVILPICVGSSYNNRGWFQISGSWY